MLLEADEITRARLFETQLRRLLSAYKENRDWKEWWEREMASVEELLKHYGVQHG